MKLSLESLLLVVLMVTPVLALDNVEVLESSGYLREESFSVASPTPAWCWWDNESTTAPHFQATNGDGYGNYGCFEPWSVHCDSDSLVYRGSWSAVESDFFLRPTTGLNSTVR